MDWIGFEERMPTYNVWFLAVDDEGKYHIRTTNMLHRIAGKDGIYTPANHGRGARLTHWLPIPPLPAKSQSGDGQMETKPDKE